MLMGASLSQGARLAGAAAIPAAASINVAARQKPGNKGGSDNRRPPRRDGH